MHLGTAYVGLRDGCDQPAGRRCGDVIFVEFNFVGSWDERDATFHGFTPKRGDDGPGFILDGKNVKPEPRGKATSYHL